jgi:hypothetical protein
VAPSPEKNAVMGLGLALVVGGGAAMAVVVFFYLQQDDVERAFGR